MNGQDQGADQWMLARISQHMEGSVSAIQRLAVESMEGIVRAATMAAATFRVGGKLLICGNGGSAADAQHMAAEFVSRLTADFVRPGLPAIALTTDSSFLTAYANDLGFDGVFARQVQALGRGGDLLIGISTSGNSRNVIEAVLAARDAGLSTLALTGAGGRLGELADHVIAVPSTQTQYIQEAQLVIEHIICDLVERLLFATGEQTPEPAATPRSPDPLAALRTDG